MGSVSPTKQISKNQAADIGIPRTSSQNLFLVVIWFFVVWCVTVCGGIRTSMDVDAFFVVDRTSRRAETEIGVQMVRISWGVVPDLSFQSKLMDPDEIVRKRLKGFRGLHTPLRACSVPSFWLFY